jgi:hypothetical protein
MAWFMVTKTVQYTEKVQVEAVSAEEAKARAEHMDGDRETDDVVIDTTAVEIK